MIEEFYPQWEITAPGSFEIPEGDVVVIPDLLAEAAKLRGESYTKTAKLSPEMEHLNALIGHEPSEDDVWQPVPNRASRRRFLKQWGQHKRSRVQRGHSIGRKPKKRTLKVVAWLS